MNFKRHRGRDPVQKAGSPAGERGAVLRRIFGRKGEREQPVVPTDAPPAAPSPSPNRDTLGGPPGDASVNPSPVSDQLTKHGYSHSKQSLWDVSERQLRAIEKHLDIAQKQLSLQEDTVKRELSEEEEKCHQLFRLTSGYKDATYEWYKNHVEARVEGTCQWFLTHDQFQRWLEQESGPLLVSADPGCGKSVLARYLIDHGLPRSATICYFFFKDQDQNTVRQALCALLHQLFSQKPFLIKHAMPEYSDNGASLVNMTALLWKILDSAVRDSQAGTIFIILDALDECAEPEFRDLIQRMKYQFYGNQPSNCKLKFLLTSRPYGRIVSEFLGPLDTFPYVHIPGEEQSEAISREINLAIRDRADRLGLSDSIRSHLAKKLLEISHRTYLWVYLVFDHLKTEGFEKTAKGVESAIKTLPKNVNEAYEHILYKSKNHQGARRALAIILAARRPLTLSEMNVVMNIQDEHESFRDFDLEEDEGFELNLRSWCGLFISVHHGKVYFFHQTAREFLLADLSSSRAVPSELLWHRSITASQAHTVLAEQCVLYLNLFNSTKSGHDIGSDAFLDYSAKNWGLHFREADIADNSRIIPSALRICSPDSVSYSAWFGVYWATTPWRTPRNWTSIFVPAHFGHKSIVKLLLAKGGVDIDSKDDFGRTPLAWAAERGHDDVIKLLLATGKVDVDSKDTEYGRTPLSWAAESGHDTVIKLLLATGKVDIDSKDTEYSRTPLSWAAETGHEAVIKLLLATGKIDIDSKSYSGRTPLLYAAESGHEAIVELLLVTGKVDIDSKSKYGRTPLSYAAESGYEAVIKLLLATGKVNVDSRDNSGRTPLSLAAGRGSGAVVKLLLATGKVDVNSKDNSGRTPLSLAAERSGEAIIMLLLAAAKVDINSKDIFGRTPLLYAAGRGHEATVMLLLKTGKVNIDSKDNSGRTPLSWAAERGCEAVIKLLLATGKVNVDSKDNSGRTPLSLAAESGHEAVVQLLQARRGT